MSAFRCTFTDNDASGGGAVYGSGSDTVVSLEYCSLVENRAQKEGGALRMYSLELLQLTRYVCSISYIRFPFVAGVLVWGEILIRDALIYSDVPLELCISPVGKLDIFLHEAGHTRSAIFSLTGVRPNPGYMDQLMHWTGCSGAVAT